MCQADYRKSEGLIMRRNRLNNGIVIVLLIVFFFSSMSKNMQMVSFAYGDSAVEISESMMDVTSKTTIEVIPEAFEGIEMSSKPAIEIEEYTAEEPVIDDAANLAPVDVEEIEAEVFEEVMEEVIEEVKEPVEYVTSKEAIVIEDLIDAEIHLIENYENMDEQDVYALIWPEIELETIELNGKTGELDLRTELMENYGKNIQSYGYVWSYDYEVPTLFDNEGVIEIGNNADVSCFTHSIKIEGTVYVRAYVIYDDQYVGYSNQRQYTYEEPTLFRSFSFLRMSSPLLGKTYFKDTGEDLDKLKIAVLANAGYLKIDLDVDAVPTESAYLVLRGKFGGTAHLELNKRFLGYVGAGTNNEYYALELSNDWVKEGRNTIEMYVYGIAWAKIDAVSLVIDGGDTSKGQITNIGFEDWSIKYNSSIDYHFTDLYTKSTTESVNSSAGLKLVNSIGLKGYNHFSSSDYSNLDVPSNTYYSRVTIPDDGDDTYETGNWNLFSMMIDNKKVLTVESKGFYYVDSVGPRNFGINFNQDTYGYTNGSVTIQATVDDLFKRPFSHIVLPDGSRVYDYKASYVVSDNEEYSFKVVEPDGTQTEFVHKVSNIDKVAPTVSLIGDATISLVEENQYIDLGVGLTDNLSGLSSYDPDIDYGGLVTDFVMPGTYTINYTSTDRAGNIGCVSRVVIVKNKPLEVSTQNITKTASLVSLKGKIEYYGEDEIIEKGLVWGCTSNPTIDNNNGIEKFTTGIVNKDIYEKELLLTSLLNGATYNVRAYVKTAGGGVVYGSNKTFDADNKNYGNFQLSNIVFNIQKGSSVTFNIERSDGSDSDVKVFYRTVNGSALAGQQFTEKSGFVTFSDGESGCKTVTVNTLNYCTWEKANREFYFEIYKIDGKGNIGIDNFATVKFIDDIDLIANVDSGAWSEVWKTDTDFTSTDNYTCNTVDYYLPSSYDYWDSRADSFLGRGKALLVINNAVMGFELRKYIGYWEGTGVKMYYSSPEYNTGYTYERDIRGATALDLNVVVSQAESVWGGDHGKVYDPSIDINIVDSTHPTITSVHAIDGNYAEGDRVFVSAKFSEIIQVTNLLDLKMNIKLYDTVGREFIQKADYFSGSGTDTLVFSFIVPENKYNQNLEFATTNFDYPSLIKDLVGNAFDGSALSIISTDIHIASIGHNIIFSPNGNVTVSTRHDTSVTVLKDAADPAVITEQSYLWATDTNVKVNGFKNFNNGEVISIDGATGNYYLHVRTKDDYGNEAYAISNIFVLNNVAPSFSLTANTTEWTNNGVTIALGNIPKNTTILTRQYKEGSFSVSDFGVGTEFGGDNFVVNYNGFYSVYLETNTGMKYVNSISIGNIDSIVPRITIGTNGSVGHVLYQASTIVSALDEGDSKLKTLQYQWTNSTAKPVTGWTDFSSGDRLEKSMAGTWYLHVKAVDGAGSETYLCSNAFIVDNEGPIISVTGNNPATWTNEAVTIIISASKDNLKHVMMPDLTTIEAVGGNVNTTFTATKNGYYSFVAVDESGNTAEAGINITKIDTDAPNVTVKKSKEGWTSNDVVLTISADDNTSVLYDSNGDVVGYSGVYGIKIKKSNSEIFETYTDEYSYTVGANGEYQVVVMDSLGNVATRNIVVSNIDKNPPFVEADNTDYGPKTDPIRVQLFYRDKEMGIVESKEYKITSNTFAPEVYDTYDGTSITLTDNGTYYIHYRALDGVGQIAQGYFGPYTIDAVIPSIAIRADEATEYKKSQTAEIAVNFKGFPEGEICYQWTNSPEVPTENWNNLIANGGIVTQSLLNGDQYLHVRATSGGSRYYGLRLFKFDNTDPVITLKGDNHVVLPYGDTYFEKGVEYFDTYDLWPAYMAPDLRVVKNDVLGSYTLEYRVTDSAGNTATVSRIVNVEDVTAPVAKSVSQTTDEDQNYPFNCDVFESKYSDDLTALKSIKVLSLPEFGTLEINSLSVSVNQLIRVEDIHNLIYRPEENWNGNISFNYCVLDSYDNESNVATVTVQVNPVNDPPMVKNDFAEIDEDQVVTINVSENDRDAETAQENLIVESVTQGSHGRVTNNNNGTLTYVPDENWNGTDSFSYTIKDTEGGMGTGSVIVSVNPVNDRPQTALNLTLDHLAPYRGGESIVVSWDEGRDLDGDALEYSLDYYDGFAWNNMKNSISGTSTSVIIPNINTKITKFRIRTFDKTVWSETFLESDIFEIDSNMPTVDVTLDHCDWTSSTIRIDFSSDDRGGSGIAYTEYSYKTQISGNSWSEWTSYTLGESCSLTHEGVYKLKVRAIDYAGNIGVDYYSGEYKIDMTPPNTFEVSIDSVAQREITIRGLTTDSTLNSDIVSGQEEIVYDFSIDGMYTGTYGTSGSHTFNELTPNQEYTFTMCARDKAGNVIETVAIEAFTLKKKSKNHAEEDDLIQGDSSIKISLNEKEISLIGHVRVENNEDEHQVIVLVDSENLIERIEALKSEDCGKENLVSISSKQSQDLVVSGLNGLTVKQMQNENTILEINNEYASYILPAKDINIDVVAEALGEQIDMKDIMVQIKLSTQGQIEMRKINNALEKEVYELVVPPVNYEITCSYNGKTVQISEFEEFVERQIAIPQGISPQKITTGVILNKDGTMEHVPTKIVEINGEYYAQINSLTNSSYTVIWNPYEFKDVENREDKSVLNNMGARLIISGNGDDLFTPDRNATRAEFIAMSIKALGLNPKELENPFKDVNPDAWYCKYVSSAYDHELISGYTDGYFRPFEVIRSYEALCIMSSAMEISGLEIEVTDQEIEELLSSYKDNKIKEWAKPAIAKCIKANIIPHEYMDGILGNKNLTRAEVASIIYTLLLNSDLI